MIKPPPISVIIQGFFYAARLPKKGHFFSRSQSSLARKNELEALELDTDECRKPGTGRSVRGIQNYNAGQHECYEETYSAHLPLPPLMDPAIIAAKERFRKPKPAQGKQLTPFQIRLRHNVFANALASPIRTCGITQARLPEDFLLGFQLKTHPETGAPWYLPKVLNDAPPDVVAEVQKLKASPTSMLDKASEVSEEPRVQHGQVLKRSPEIRDLSAYHSQARMIGCRSVVEDSQVQDGKYKGWTRIVPRRLQEKGMVKVRNIVWREDMADFVLNLLRDRVVERLKHLLRGGHGYLARSVGGLDGVQKNTQVGCVMWLGPTSSPPSVPSSEETGYTNVPAMAPLLQSAEIDGSLSVDMMNYGGRQVPLYDLIKLLGEVHLEYLRTPCSLFDSEVVVIKNKRNTVPARSCLWRLQGYMADSGCLAAMSD